MKLTLLLHGVTPSLFRRVWDLHFCKFSACRSRRMKERMCQIASFFFDRKFAPRASVLSSLTLRIAEIQWLLSLSTSLGFSNVPGANSANTFLLFFIRLDWPVKIVSQYFKKKKKRIEVLIVPY